MHQPFLAVLLGTLIMTGVSVEAHAAPAMTRLAPTILWDSSHLARVKAAWKNGDQTYAREMDILKNAADSELGHEPYTIVRRRRPSGTAYDPHDYYSMGP